MSKRGTQWLLVLVALLTPVTLPAEEAAAQPAEVAKVDMKITVGKVEGSVEYRTAEDKPWGLLKEGMVLGPGAEISGSLRSHALLLFSDNSEVLVKGITQMKVEAFHRTATTNVTRIGLTFGSLKQSVHKGTRANDFKVKAATYVMAVTGTKIEETSYFPGYGGNVQMGGEGTVKVTGQTKKTRSVTAGERTDDKNTSPIVFAKRRVVVPVLVEGQTKREVKSALLNSRVVSTFELLRSSTPSNQTAFFQERRHKPTRPFEQGVKPPLEPW